MVENTLIGFNPQYSSVLLRRAILWNFLDGYFLNELVPWMGSFLNYRFSGRVPKKISNHISNLNGSWANFF